MLIKSSVCYIVHDVEAKFYIDDKDLLELQ